MPDDSFVASLLFSVCNTMGTAVWSYSQYGLAFQRSYQISAQLRCICNCVPRKISVDNSLTWKQWRFELQFTIGFMCHKHTFC